ncbi:MAG TPA: DUF1028 domain-containing protein [Planctomycetota bacterium]|jgi:uncharacterized Ntn-hydrolase superfamily protein|nr:DUF1028 domain-containing protein [Planctomycetota bacterium]
MARADRLRLAVAGALLPLLGVPASATWSIVVANTATGEVGVASATCLAGFNLQLNAGVIVVGRGAAQAQALVDESGGARRTIFNEMQIGVPAQAILQFLQQIPSVVTIVNERQYGIVTLGHPPATYTGAGTLQWSGGVAGQTGPIAYAIQGNILTCAAVITAAEQALINTPGDLGEKVMAAMQAAKSFGGDGRCSCAPLDPMGCGCPPPAFLKSAHVAYMTIARIGDTDGTCSLGTGCINGDYYLDLNVVAPANAPDPVNTLQTMFNGFRTSRAGHADAIHSLAGSAAAALPADGGSGTTLTIALSDIDGNPLTTGGATVTVSHDATSAGSSTIGPVSDLGNGSYEVPLTAGTESGTDVLRVVVDDGLGPVTLFPFPTLSLVTPGPLLLEVAGTAEGHRLGTSVAPAGDLDGDGRGDLVVGIPGASPGGFPYSGQAKVFSGRDGEVLLTFDGTVEEGRLGSSVAMVGDVDADCVPDFLAGAPSCPDAGCVPGTARLFSGATGSAILAVSGTDAAERFGASVAGAGDLNGDGIPDFLVGSPGGGGGSARAFSGADGSPLHLWTGEDAGDGLGSSVASTEDADGDGVPEVLLGAPGADPVGVLDAGAVLVVSGLTGAVIRTLEGGGQPGEEFGSSVAAAGRVDADGVEDWIVGSPSSDVGALADAGRAWIFSGATGAPLQVLEGEAAGARFGSAVAGLPDGNGDLRGEVAVGAPGRGPGGEVGVFSAANGLLVFSHAGLSGDLVGDAVATAGDLDGDGVADLLLGAPGADPSRALDAGQARVFSLTGIGGAIPVELRLRARVALPRVLAEPDADASGRAELRLEGRGQSLEVEVRQLDAGGGSPYAAFLEDAVGSGSFLSLGELEAASPASGRWRLSLTGEGAPPAQLGGALLASLEGRRLEVRDSSGKPFLRARLPSLAGMRDLRKAVSLASEYGRGSSAPASATLRLSRKGSKGTERFELRAKGLPSGPAYGVWIADRSGSLAQAGALTKGRMRLDTGRGDPLPLGVGRLEDLACRAIEVRDGASVVLTGTVP